MKNWFMIVAIAGTLACGINSKSVAQSENVLANASKRVSVNFENADIRYALKQLFQSISANFLLDASVSGRSTVSLNDVTFKVALESILKSNASLQKLTYRIEDGVYHIAPVQDDQPIVTRDDTPKDPEKPKHMVTSIHLNYADVEDITRALGGQVIQNRFSGVTGILGGAMGGRAGGQGGGLNGGGLNGGVLNGGGLNGGGGTGSIGGNFNSGGGTTVIRGPGAGNSNNGGGNRR
ncbi:MAG: hypothetical protein ABJA67_03095 [Chthonomonadales bacterium]